MKSSGTFLEISSPDTQQNQPDHISFSSEFFGEAGDLEESWNGEKKHLNVTEQLWLFLAKNVFLFYNFKYLLEVFSQDLTCNILFCKAHTIYSVCLLHSSKMHAVLLKIAGKALFTSLGTVLRSEFMLLNSEEPIHGTSYNHCHTELGISVASFAWGKAFRLELQPGGRIIPTLSRKLNSLSEFLQ